MIVKNPKVRLSLQSALKAFIQLQSTDSSLLTYLKGCKDEIQKALILLMKKHNVEFVSELNKCMGFKFYQDTKTTVSSSFNKVEILRKQP